MSAPLVKRELSRRGTKMPAGSVVSLTLRASCPRCFSCPISRPADAKRRKADAGTRRGGTLLYARELRILVQVAEPPVQRAL
jgi:hypothetical protein